MNRIQRPLSDIVKDIHEHYSKSKLNQSTYADLADVSQSSVSRLLGGKGPEKSISSTIKKLCNYADIPIWVETHKDVKDQSELLRALQTIWDGTDAHAKDLTRLLTQFGRASRCPPPTETGKQTKNE